MFEMNIRVTKIAYLIAFNALILWHVFTNDLPLTAFLLITYLELLLCYPVFITSLTISNHKQRQDNNFWFAMLPSVFLFFIVLWAYELEARDFDIASLDIVQHSYFVDLLINQWPAIIVFISIFMISRLSPLFGTTITRQKIIAHFTSEIQRRMVVVIIPIILWFTVVFVFILLVAFSNTDPLDTGLAKNSVEAIILITFLAKIYFLDYKNDLLSETETPLIKN